MGAPSLTRLTPRAFSTGDVSEITLSGSELGIGTIWSSCPGAIEITDITASRMRLRHKAGTLDGDALPGIYALRLFATNGASNLLPFMVDDLPTALAGGTNTTRETAQALAGPCGVEGAVPELGFHWYRLQVTKGQHVTAEVVAARLGSRLDSVLRAVDARGRELASDDDASGLRCESYLAFTPPYSGDCWLELRDVNYGGGDDYFYRLRVGDFPLATAVIPTPGNGGHVAGMELTGPAGGIRKPATAGLGHGVFAAAVRGRAGSSFASGSVDLVHDIVEAETVDSIKKANVVAPPCVVHGRLEKSDDRDVYRLAVRKGEHLMVRAQTRSIGSPCDVALELQSTNGERLAASNINSADEGTLSHTFKEAGVALLVVREINGAFGTGMIYRVGVEPSPAFSLEVDADVVQAKAGGSFDLKIVCSRNGFKEPITLAIPGIDGLSLSNNIIAAGKTNVTLLAHVPGGLMVAAPLRFFVIGRAGSGEAPAVRARTSAAALRKVWPQLIYPPPGFDGWVALGVTQ